MNCSRLRLALALVFASSLAAPSAHASGGTFGDDGPQVMPVDQTGATILFWVDEAGSEPHIEAHIQLHYEGDADDFAWIIPVPAVPEVMVGSKRLFDNLLRATEPSFTVIDQTVGDCNGGGCGQFPEPPFEFSDTGGFETNEEGDPDILDRGLADVFEYVTLTGNNVEEIVDWLDANGYAQDPDAPPILAEYLQENFVFVALKLKAGVGVDEIHPIVIRYAGTEPRIPIRLTRIAAVDDMDIRVLFLGEQRFAPLNWAHVVLNQSRLDWVNGPTQEYPGLVSLAIDEAGGRAFVTEYAGTDDAVSTSGLSNLSWNASAFEAIEPALVVTALFNQGLINCSGNGVCTFLHPQVEPLLRKYLPAPVGLDEQEFWECLSCYVDQIDPVAWAAQPGFAVEFAERITGPGQHAVDMLDDATQLTRMFTLISPHEMIEDPTFHAVDSLPSVDEHSNAQGVDDCAGGPSYFELPPSFMGRTVALTSAGTMPDLEGNPAALRIERIPMTGPVQVEVDNAELIDELLDDWNDKQLVGPEPLPSCAVQGFGARELLAMFGIFGIAWFNRRKRG